MYNFIFIATYKTVDKIEGGNDPRWSGTMTATWALTSQLFFLWQLIGVIFNVDFTTDISRLSLYIPALIFAALSMGGFFFFYNKKRIQRLLSLKKYSELKFSFFNVIKFIFLIFAPLVAGIILLNNY